MEMPHDIKQLRALLARVAKLTEPDRDLSNDIQKSLGGWRHVWCEDTDMAYWWAPDKKYADTPDFLPPDVTASIDAVEDLLSNP